MKQGNMNILMAVEDGRDTAQLARDLVLELGSDVTIVNTVDEAQVLMRTTQYDAVVATARLDDGVGLSILSIDDLTAHPPVIILGESDSAQQVIEAIRAGAADAFSRPIENAQVIASIERVARRHRRHRVTAHRSKRLRRMTSRLVKDRRELRQRVDLICRDLVQAYQKLAEKVVEIQQVDTGA